MSDGLRTYYSTTEAGHGVDVRDERIAFGVRVTNQEEVGVTDYGVAITEISVQNRNIGGREVARRAWAGTGRRTETARTSLPRAPVAARHPATTGDPA